MKEEPLHPWIEPDLEARIVALVLGESSDFESEELERLIEKRTELAMFKKRMEAVHALLRDVATGESLEDAKDWKLADDRRAAVLSVIDGEGEANKKTQTSVTLKATTTEASKLRPHKKNSSKKSKASALSIAIIVHLGLAALLMLYVVYTPTENPTEFFVASQSHSYDADEISSEKVMKMQKSQRSPISPAHRYSINEADIASRSLASVATPPMADSASIASAAAVVERDSIKESRLALSSIRENLQGQKADAPATSNYKQLGHGGRVLSSPDNDLVTTAYKVSPSFMSAAAENNADINAAADPFAEPTEETSTQPRRRTAKNILVEAGVTFAPGSSVIYNAETSELIVRNTQDQLELVQAYKDSIKGQSNQLSFPNTNDTADVMSANSADGFQLAATTDSSDSFADDAYSDELAGGKADKESPHLGHGQITPITILGKSLNIPQSAPFIASAGSANVGALTTIGENTDVITIDPIMDENQRAELTSRSNDGSTGGNISRLGESKVTVAREASMDVSGLTEGGQINIGGGFQGKSKKAPLPNVQTVRIPEGNINLPQNAGLYASAGGSGTMTGVFTNAARNQTRTDFLRQEAAGWELPVPTKIRGGVDIDNSKSVKAKSDARAKGKSHGNAYAGAKKNASALRIAGSPTISGRVELLKKREQINTDSTAAGEAWETPKTGGKIDNNLARYAPAKHEWQRYPNHPATVPLKPALNSSPKVTARSGGRAVVEQGRKLIVTKDSDSPNIPEEESKQTMDKLYHLTPKVVGGGSRSGTTKIKKIKVAAGGPITLGFVKTKKKLSKISVKPSASASIQIKKSPVPSGLNEKSASDEAFSTFSLHVSDVSFKLAQAALAKGEWPAASKVRIEEFVNAFDYGDAMPNANEKVACQMEQAIHPFLQQRNLLRVSMRTAAAGRSSQTPLRLTFLLDNSGSMERSDRQQTVRRAFALLTQQLQPMDQVTLISFARQPRLLADQVSGDKADQLIKIVSNLPSEGGTNFEAALQLAFEKAQEQQIDQAQNRIIMLTDGAANLGNADPDRLSKMIENMRTAGIAFDAAGIGADGLNDEILEALTRKGDGRYYLLDRPENADEGFARQIAGALRPSAKNVKVQIEFNPKRVGKYKLLGFEKHRLNKEDFRNDQVDAAEMAAAEAGVAVYQFEAKADGEGDVGSVSVRFLDMNTGLMVENRWPIPYQADAPRLEQAAPSIRIASAAALLAAKLKGSADGSKVDLQTLSNLIANLPAQQRQNKRVQQLQQMLNVARASNP